MTARTLMSHTHGNSWVTLRQDFNSAEQVYFYDVETRITGQGIKMERYEDRDTAVEVYAETALNSVFATPETVLESAREFFPYITVRIVISTHTKGYTVYAGDHLSTT